MRWILRGIGVLLLIAVVFAAGLMLIPGERIARIAAEQLSRMSGREVSITGDVDVTFWPRLGVSAGGLEVGGAEGTDALLTASTASIGVDAGALLRGEIVITEITADSPVIRLVQHSDGRASWRFSDPASGAEIEAAPVPARDKRPLSIRKLTVQDATLIYAAEGLEPLRLDGVDLALDWPTRDAPAEFTASMAPAGTPVILELRIAEFADFLEGGVQPLGAALRAGGGAVNFNGRGSLAGALAGDLLLDSPDMGRLMTALGLPAGAQPRWLGDRVVLETALSLTPERALALRDIDAKLGGNRVTGKADVTLYGTPRITAALSAGTLDLATEATPAADSETGRTDTPQDGWSTEPIDAAWLAAFDGVIDLDADSIALNGFKAGPTRLQLRNERARMVFDLKDMQAYDGRIGGEFVMNNRDGLSVGGALTAEGVQMRQLLEDAAGITRFTGLGDARLSFLGVGQSMAEIMRSLEGEGRIDMGRGTVAGIDLDALLGSVDAKGGSTVFDSASASFDIKEGVLRNDDLRVLLPNFDATGEGEVDLGARSIDYKVTPKALRVNRSRGGLAVPVTIRGPWADPKIRPDLGAAIDLNFAEEKKRAEDRLKRKVQKELDVSPDDARDLEDLVKDELENVLKRELLKLFD